MMTRKFFPSINPVEYEDFRVYVGKAVFPPTYDEWLAQHQRLMQQYRAMGQHFVARPITISLREFQNFLHGQAPNEHQLFRCAEALARNERSDRKID